MKISVICVGDELLSGDTLNTNLLYIGDKLSCAGFRVCSEICVPDTKEDILLALEDCRHSDIVITIGGLGPTRDDMTRPTVAEYLGRRLILNPAIRTHIAEYLGERAKRMPADSLDVQAEIPEGATVLENHNGTAPGLAMYGALDKCAGRKALYIMLPGPPREMRPMFDNQAMPLVLAGGKPEWEERSMRIIGVGESIVEHTVRECLGGNADRFHLAYCIKNDNVLVKIAKRHGDAELDLDAAFLSLCGAFGYHRIPEDCASAVAYLGEILKERHMTVSTAESCTGGGIAAALTDIPGSSEWFTGAFVTYSNEWKKAQLGVSAETLEKFGAVSEETVSEMLDGLLKNGGADLGIAVSGIAGPGGGTPDKPVGTVYIGIAGKDWKKVTRMHFNGLRDSVRLRTASTAISMMISALCDKLLA